MAYITLDFGSSNSGAILNTSIGKDYNPSDLIYIHRQDGDTGFTKQPSVFWIKRDLIMKSSVSETDINIYSCVFHDEDNLQSANFIWCQNQIKKVLPLVMNNNEWIRIEHPKMALYKVNTDPNSATCLASDGTRIPLKKILHIFFLVILKESLKKSSDAGLYISKSDINWAITVPGLAIWNRGAVNIIKEIASSVFGNQVTLLSEPECALIGINLSGKADLDFVKDRYSLVVDLGGGTVDICVMKESRNEDGSETFDEIKSTKAEKDPTTSERAGGNDIDHAFISFFCGYLVEGVYNEDSPVLLYKNFRNDNPVGAMEFENAWRKLQYSENIDDNIVDFSPGRPFTEWLKTHYPAAASKRGEYGFSLDGASLRATVFEPIYRIILSSLEENLVILKHKHLELDTYYFAGGLSLDKHLKKRINTLVSKYFPFAKKKESADGAVVGAVQRGGNHILVNKEKLIRRIARKTFYTQFAIKYPGNSKDLRDELISNLRYDYHERLGCPYISDAEINKIIDEQWDNLVINYSDSSVLFLTPLCLKYAPVTQVRSFPITPYRNGQEGVEISVYSSDKDYRIFVNEEIKDEGCFYHNFHTAWTCANLVFDPNSNAVSGTALFKLTDENGNTLEEFVIHNVSKRGY